jgi:cytoskeletal protein RodZ
MADFGAGLKQAREANGVSLREISAATKISMGALEALERDDFSRLPGGIFSRAFVRAYAQHAGLDPDQTVDRFLQALEQYERDAAKAAPRREVTADDRAFLARQQRAARILRASALTMVVLVVGALLMWRFLPTHRAPAAPENPSPPASVAPPVVPPVAAPAKAAPAPDVSAPASDRLAFAIEASGPCWVQVTSDGSVVLSKILQAGERQTFQADREVYLQIGNAGVLSWTINGQAAKSLGNPGQAAYVRVTRDNYRQFVQ